MIIICSPLASVETSLVIERFKALKFAKILLIDIAGSVFNTNIEIYKKFANFNEYHNILVLTILNEKMKQMLKITFPEFIQYFNTNNNVPHEMRNYHFCSNLTTLSLSRDEKDAFICENRMKMYCNEYLNVSMIKQFCNQIITSSQVPLSPSSSSLSVVANEMLLKEKEEENATTSAMMEKTDHIIFSEYFNLFNFISNFLNNESTTHSDSNDSVHARHRVSTQFEFVVLNFENITNELNETKIVWRPFIFLQHNQFNRNQFIMHTIISDSSDDDGSVGYHNFIGKSRKAFWSCGIICWSIITIGILVLIIIIFISVLVGIAVR